MFQNWNWKPKLNRNKSKLIQKLGSPKMDENVPKWIQNGLKLKEKYTKYYYIHVEISTFISKWTKLSPKLPLICWLHNHLNRYVRWKQRLQRFSKSSASASISQTANRAAKYGWKDFLRRWKFRFFVTQNTSFRR